MFFFTCLTCSPKKWNMFIFLHSLWKETLFCSSLRVEKILEKQLLVFSIFSNFFRNFGSKPCNQVRVTVQKKGLDNIVSARYWTFSSPFMSNKHVCWKKKKFEVVVPLWELRKNTQKHKKTRSETKLTFSPQSVSASGSQKMTLGL